MLQTREKNRLYDIVVSGARSILEKKNFPETARTIFDYCREMTGAQSGYVALLSDTGEENEVLFLEAGGLPCDVNPNLPMPIRGLRGLCYETHKTVFENDFMKSDWIKYMPARHVVLHNVMFVPLNLEGKTVGIMGLANKQNDFNQEDAEIASVFGDLAAIALENSRYIELLTEKTNALEKAMSELKTLRGIIPICMHCKGIRDDQGDWNQLEAYISEHSDAHFSHGLCDKCLEKYYPDEGD
jgi:GAF domain-containing protein